MPDTPPVVTPKKKQPAASHEGHSLEAFRDRLRDLCGHDLEGARHDRPRLAKDQAKQALALADELGLLIHADATWEEFRDLEPDRHVGTEHIVELTDDLGRVGKLTIPPKFGLIPQIITHAVPNLRGEPGTRQAIEFIHATPLE